MIKIDKRLYPFQKKAVKFLEKRDGWALIGDEMGTGKTVEALAWLQLRPDIGKVLVVVPAIGVLKWAEEVRTWTDRRPGIITGYYSERPTERLQICSYNVMAHRFRELRKEEWDLIIWDEAHYLKGAPRKVKRVAAARTINSERHMFLTGTPLINRPIELLNILTMLEPKKWNLSSYGSRYCGGMSSYEGPYRGAENLEELAQRIKHLMLRRLKREVLAELPDITRVILPVEIDLAMYKSKRKEMTPANALVKVNELWHIVGLEKAKLAAQWVENFFASHDTNKKLVIYAHHLDVIDYLKGALRHYGADSIDGRASSARRDGIIRAFQKSPRPRVVVINRAGGESINLFGEGLVDCSDILFVERQWSPAIEEQAEGRLDRIGQKNAVTAWYLAAAGTYDTVVAALVERKRAILSDIIRLAEVETTVKQEVLSLLRDDGN